MGGGGEGGGEESYDDQEDRYENGVGPTPDARVPGTHVPGARVPGTHVPGARVVDARVPGGPTPDAHKGHHYISADPSAPSLVGKRLMGGVCC